MRHDNGFKTLWNRFRTWFGDELRRKPWRVWLVAVTDILLIGLCLLVFALFHHVLPRGGVDVEAPVLNRVAAVETVDTTAQQSEADLESLTDVNTVTQEQTAETVTEPAAEKVGYFGTKFADKFTNGEVIRTETTYQSANVNITVTPYDQSGVQFFVEDIYIKDISCLQTGFAKNTFGFGYSEWPLDIANRLGAVAAINGDYYGLRPEGLVIRNGVLYKDCEFPERDVAVLYTDGTMKTYPSTIFDSKAEMEKGAWQAWNFGPMLLDEQGNPKSSFNTDVSKPNPRTAIGYYEPGHYCFVTVDGRSEDSSGVGMEALSKLMYNLGCKTAINMDGGKTAQMAFNGQLVNNPCDGGRECSDVVVILDIAA